jgi:hypothetical protein
LILHIQLAAAVPTAAANCYGENGFDVNGISKLRRWKCEMIPPEFSEGRYSADGFASRGRSTGGGADEAELPEPALIA